MITALDKKLMLRSHSYLYGLVFGKYEQKTQFFLPKDH